MNDPFVAAACFNPVVMRRNIDRGLSTRLLPSILNNAQFQPFSGAAATTGRNEPRPCSSGKKFTFCCMNRLD